jgi:hypothetical protein
MPWRSDAGGASLAAGGATSDSRSNRRRRRSSAMCRSPGRRRCPAQEWREEWLAEVVAELRRQLVEECAGLGGCVAAVASPLLGHSHIRTTQRAIPLPSSSSRRRTLLPTGRPCTLRNALPIGFASGFPLLQNAASASWRSPEVPACLMDSATVRAVPSNAWRHAARSARSRSRSSSARSRIRFTPPSGSAPPPRGKTCTTLVLRAAQPSSAAILIMTVNRSPLCVALTTRPWRVVRHHSRRAILEQGHGSRCDHVSTPSTTASCPAIRLVGRQYAGRRENHVSDTGTDANR